LKPKQYILEWILKRFKIPHSAVSMFKASNDISGINKSTLPTELIPLNSIQLSRGLLNFVVFQSSIKWILPYWAFRQYNPDDVSFIPRSHTGLSINVTHRNWTAVGNPDCSIKPIIDPRGLVTPFTNGWSIDVWLIADNEIFYPSASENCTQSLIENLPIVETKFENVKQSGGFEGVSLILTSFPVKNMLIHRATIINNNMAAKNCRLIFSLRPFNPEGVSLINKISFDSESDCFTINEKEQFYFDKRPDIVHCSNFEKGEAFEILSGKENGKSNLITDCPFGIANAIAVFDIQLNFNESFEVQSYIPLLHRGVLNKDKPPNKININYDLSIEYWNKILTKGTAISTPDEKLNSVLKNSLTTLLMLTDNKTITPGPFTYHQFWFRDAAYMLLALDKFGFTDYTTPIIRSFPEHQLSSGYFRSQKGEWDSNGQALWISFNHYLLTGDAELLAEIFESLYSAVKWISETRLTGADYIDKNYYGLLPQGISAEHLGHSDHYFWDNYWSLAGLKSFIKICEILGKEKEKDFTEKLLKEYFEAIEKSIESVQKKYSIKEIPASPSRNIDCGMIGSICACYPLQLFTADDERIVATLNTLNEKFFHNGLFFQQFIHSGMNIYLTLQIAHSFLYSGNRKKFWEIFNSVLSMATSTFNYPEAIHPLTGGGIMGDGHHGWAAAEIASAVRDAFVYEPDLRDGKEVLLFPGIPLEWFEAGKEFSVRSAPISSGKISMQVSSSEEKINIEIEFYPIKETIGTRWKLILPFKVYEILEGENKISFESTGKNETILYLQPKSWSLKALYSREVKSFQILS
jgi:hypothetical protein